MNRAKVLITPQEIATAFGYADAKVLYAYLDQDPQWIGVVMEHPDFPDVAKNDESTIVSVKVGHLS